MRPKLTNKINSEVFLDYYWLKDELVFFCKQNGIPNSGSKNEITERIFEYLKSGKIIFTKKNSRHNQKTSQEPLSLESKIPEEYKNDERHRAFFKSVIGEHFKFNVPFMKWMKKNHVKTYKEAVDTWKRITDDKKLGQKYEISPQFQYNQYIRDFFEANPGVSKEDAIKCWKYKKTKAGHNKYEEGDKVSLKVVS